MRALGYHPRLISRIGNDALGQQLITAMQQWGMDTTLLQQDNEHPTGQVNVSLVDGEPRYDIVTQSAWDYIEMPKQLPSLTQRAVLYHGSLAARHSVSRQTLENLIDNTHIDVFVDVNLRDPWWQKDWLFRCLERARWVKMNQDEFAMLGFNAADLQQDMTRMHSHFHLDQLIITCGEKGAIIRDKTGVFHHSEPDSTAFVVDTVGAGDGFAAVYLHGLLQQWSIQHSLQQAQRFASKIISQRGAVLTDKAAYSAF